MKDVIYKVRDNFISFLGSRSFIWLFLFGILYLFNSNRDDKLDIIKFSDANLLAVVILDYKYEIEFLEHEPNTISLLIPKNMDKDLKKTLLKIINSDKTTSQIYKELAGDLAISHYIDIMEKIDKKKYVRQLVIKE